MGSGTNCTSGTAAAAADVEGWATGNAVAAAVAAGCRGCATVNSASDTAAEMEFDSVANTSAERVSCGVAGQHLKVPATGLAEAVMDVAAPPRL